MELALGTVQFGIGYGVAGAAAPVAEGEAKQILAAAYEGGVRRLDTAPAYGDIEERLARLCGPYLFSIVSKIPPMPAGIDTREIPSWLRQTVERSRRRIGERLRGLIFHDAALPFGAQGELVRDELKSLLQGTGIETGSSHYGPETLGSPAQWPEQTMAQLPGNAYDQRLSAISLSEHRLEISMRSSFLQGLLLLDATEAAQRVPAAAAWLDRWSNWCNANKLTKLEAAIGIAKNFSNASYCLVGVQTLREFHEIQSTWENIRPIAAPNLAGQDPRVLDPRKW